MRTFPKFFTRFLSRTATSKKSRSMLIDECGLALLVILLIALATQFRPVVHAVRLSFSSTQVLQNLPQGLPYNIESKDPLLTVFFTLSQRSVLQPTLFTVRADDCLQSLVINGRAVPQDVIGPCVIDTPRDIRIGSFLRDGDNDVVAVIPDSGGRQGFGMTLSHADPALLAILTILLLTFITFVTVVVRNRIRTPASRTLVALLTVGLLFRLFYFGVTTYAVRSNDADGHLEYIEYMAEHHTVPPVNKGWQFYQPPLYYAVSGTLFSLSRSLGFDRAFSIRLLQLFSVFLSFLTLAVCVWMSRMLFTPRQKAEQLLFVAFFAFFPGMILLAPKLNNDSLACLLSFVVVALLLRFWQRAETRTWYVLMIILGLGMLTKMTVALLVPVAFFLVFLQPARTFRSKCLLTFFGLWILLTLTQWLFFLRLFQDANVQLVGNVGNLNSGLLIPNTLSDYLTFNPWEILRHPFINPWSDTERRAYFLEYLFRSSFFGEFNFGSTLRFLSQCLLAFGMLFTLVGLVAACTGIRRHFRTAFPLWVLFVVVLVGHAFFRFRYPYASSQDFRYSAILLVPLAYFVLRVMQQRSPLLRSVWYTLLSLFLFCAAAFMTAATVLNPS